MRPSPLTGNEATRAWNHFKQHDARQVLLDFIDNEIESTRDQLETAKDYDAVRNRQTHVSALRKLRGAVMSDKLPLPLTYYARPHN